MSTGVELYLPAISKKISDDLQLDTKVCLVEQQTPDEKFIETRSRLDKVDNAQYVFKIFNKISFCPQVVMKNQLYETQHNLKKRLHTIYFSNFHNVF